MSGASVAGAEWLEVAGLQRLLAALNADGEQARVAGGAVRNALLGEAVADVDIATTTLPDETIRRAEKAGFKAIPTGIEHGTVTVIAEGTGYEVTTLRADVETDGRRAKVAFGRDWKADAGRRDFTINALYAEADGTIVDFVGGLADLESRTLRFIGDAEARIREDYLRILRFFRFFAWYGRGAPDAAGLAACAALKDGMDRLSAERVSKELLKLLAAPDPVATLAAMAQAGVLAVILPEAACTEAFARMTALSGDALLRLSVLLPRDPGVVDAAARRLRLSNAQRERLVQAAGDPVEPGLDDRAARAALYRLGAAAFRDRLLRRMAETGEGGRGQALAALAAEWTTPALPVGGRDLARLGLAPGPETGRVLKAFEDGWIADDFPDHGHEARLKALIGPA